MRHSWQHFLCVQHFAPVTWFNKVFYLEFMFSHGQPSGHLECQDVLYKVLSASPLQSQSDAHLLCVKSLLFALSYFHLGCQTSTLPAACRRAELELGVWRRGPLAFEGVRHTKAGALSNKLARPCRLNQRYGNGGIKVRTWPPVASDGEVFTDFYVRLCATKSTAN